MNSTSIEKRISLSLDQASGVPFYRQIIQQIELAIISGRLKPGSRLPTIRSLAIELKINPNTIAKAYSELEIRGLVITQVGSGTYISNKKPEKNNSERKNNIARLLRQFVREMDALGVSIDDIPALLKQMEEEL
jgi:GntR family transcriptional regulator